MPVYDDFIQPTAIHIQLDLKDNDPKLAPVLTSTTTVPSGSDGKLVFAHPSLTAKAGLSAPAKDSDVRTVQGSATKLVVSGELRNSIGRGKNHVCLRFSDLHVGALLERYAPCGLEGHLIDKVTVAVINVPRSWEIRTNGKKTGLSVEWAKVRSSDIYFYVGEVVSETSFDVDGRVSVEAFSSERGVDWKRVEARTKAVVAEMTDRFGAMSHKKLLIEINRRHSMEYAGALSCRPKHLAHELTHMWFGRGACRPKNSDAGWLDEAGVRRELENAHALVLPSFAEGLPMVVMEAMASARPCIATWVAGTTELMQDGRTGWLVPAGDAMALAEAITELATCPEDKLKRMATTARARVLMRHNIDSEAAKLAGLFSQRPRTQPL